MNTTILESTEVGEFPVDIYQKLSNDRILFISGEITDRTATDVVATLLLKDHENSESKITLFINSEGGSIRSTLMIYDIMCMINSPIETVCIGAAMDEAAIILVGGTAGMRFATKNSIVSVSQLYSEHYVMSDLTDAKTILENTKIDNKRVMDIIAKRTNKTLKQVMLDFDRRVFMNSGQAVKYGLVDKIIQFHK